MELNLDDRQVDLVEEGFDVAMRIGRLQDSNLIARKIAPCRQVLCASPAYLAKRGEPERPEDLLEHSCILYSLLSAPREWRLIGPDGELHTRADQRLLQSNNGLVNRAAAIAGGGIVLLPTFYLGEQLRSGELKPVLCRFKPQELAVHAVYPERRNLMPKVRAFVDFLAATFGPRAAVGAGLDACRSEQTLQSSKRRGGSREPPLNGQHPPDVLTFQSAPNRLRNPTLYVRPRALDVNGS